MSAHSSKLSEVLPALYAELETGATERGLHDLLEQLPNLIVTEWSGDSDVLWIDIGGTRSLNVVERNIIGVRHGETIVFDSFVLDTDNFGRVTHIELLAAADVYVRLDRSSVPRS